MGLLLQRGSRRGKGGNAQPSRRKGTNLHGMASLGLPVPPGFTITTEVCTYFYANGKTYPPDLAALVDAAVAEVERLTGRVFGDAANPLLLSVRSARGPRCPA